MHETIKKMAQVFEKQRERRRRACAIFTALAILVSLTTTYMLVQPANTMAIDYVCGMEAHIHSEDCYRLICGYYDESEEEDFIENSVEDEAIVPDAEPPEAVPDNEGTAGGDAEEPPIIEEPVEEETVVASPEVKEDPAIEEPVIEEPAVEESVVVPENEQPAEEVKTETEQPETPVQQEPSAESEQPAEAPREESVVSDPVEVPSVQEEPAVQAPVVVETAPAEPTAPAASEAVIDSGSEAFSGTISMAMVMYTNSQESSESASESAGTVEVPVVEAPVVESPAVETPAVQEPVVENVVVEALNEEPSAEEPVAEAPAEESSAVEEAPAEEPVVEDVAADTPEKEVTEEPADGEIKEESSEENMVEEDSEVEAVEKEVSSGGSAGGHVHTAACYELICDLPEHEHSEECLSLINLLEDLADLPEGYNNEYNVLGDGYAVAVFAPDGALPEGTRLTATLLEEGDDAYTTAEQTLEAMAAQEMEVHVAGVMSESALEEAIASAADDTNPEEVPVEEPVIEEDVQTPVEETKPVEEVLTASLTHNDNAPVEETEEEVAETTAVVEEIEEVIEEERVAPEIAEVTEEVTDEPEETISEEPVLYESEFSYDGFVALDIHFELDGEEIEPTKPVFVYMNVKGLLPEDVDPDSVAIQHHVEVKEEKSALQEALEDLIPALASEPVVEAVEMVADSTESTGTVEAEGSDVSGLFAVDSFSTFTVTYNTMLLQDVIMFLADDIYPNLSGPNRTTISPVSTDSNGDEFVRLTSIKKSEEADGRVDPWVYFDLKRTVDITKYDALAIAYKANAPCDGRNMELYLLNSVESSETENWVLRQPLTSSDEVQHVYYDLSTVNAGNHSTLTRFRWDYVADSNWADNDFGQVDIYAIYLFDTASASPEAREGDVTDSNVENITFKLFDYSLYINKDQNSDGSYSDNTTVAPYFTFRDSSAEDNAYGYNNNKSHENTAVDEDGYTKNHAKVKPVLGGDGYPVLEASAANGASLNYLFGGASHHAVTQYSPKNTILQKKGTHYAYNSAANAVDYDPNANQFNVRPYVERNVTTAGYSKTVDGEVVSFGDFHPLNYSGGNVVGIHSNSTPYQFIRKDVNYWYGMTMEFDFQMQNNGKILVDNGDGTTREVPMIFEFSGDDDVWVFIDDVLVLDLGGTHGTVDGSINFETGQVLQYLSWAGANSTEEAKTLGTVDGKKTGTSFPTTLKQCYTTAGKDPKGGWNANNVTFANYTTHTLKFFYLERGAAVANCKLDFNMPIVPENGLRVEKQLDTQSGIGYVNRNTDYAFRLLKTKDGVDTVLTNQEYTLWDQTNTKIDTKTTAKEDGLFILKAGQSALFESLAVNAEETYKVQELIPKSSNQIYSKVLVNDPVNVGAVVEATASGTETIGGVIYDVYTSQPQSLVENGVAKAPTFSVINQLRVHDLVIEKEVQYLGGGTAPGDTVFDMEVTVVNGTGLPVGTKYTLVNADGSETPNVEMKKAGIVSLKHGQKAKFTLLYNSSYVVKETMASSAGFSVRYEIDGTACTENEAAGSILNDTTVKVTNTTGPELPSTGGIGTHIYTILGTVLMLGAGVLLLDQRRRREGPSAT